MHGYASEPVLSSVIWSQTAGTDLAERAARKAIEAAGIEPRDIDLIVLGTTTPDRIYPATAASSRRG